MSQTALEGSLLCLLKCNAVTCNIWVCVILRCVIPAVCRKTDGEVNFSHGCFQYGLGVRGLLG